MTPQNLRKTGSRKTNQGSTQAAWCTVDEDTLEPTSSYYSFPYFSDVAYNNTSDNVTDEDASGITKTLEGGAKTFSAEYTIIQQDYDTENWIEEELAGNTIRIVQEERSVAVDGYYPYKVFHATVDENWSKNQKSNERGVTFNGVAAPSDIAIDLTCTELPTAGGFAVTLTGSVTLPEKKYFKNYQEAEV